MAIKTVGVVGAGTMGNGIAQVFAQSGFTVKLHDASRRRRRRARRRRSRRASRSSSRRASSPPPTRRRARRACIAAPSLDDLADVDYVVEAIVENARRQARRCSRGSTRSRGPTSSSASNTSSISITRARRGDEAARQRARHALHEPGAADDAGRADPRPGDVRRRRCRRRSSCARRSARRRSRPPTTPASSPTAS